MKAAALCPADTQDPRYRVCAELAVSIGAVKLTRMGAPSAEHSPASALQPDFRCITSLDELEPLSPAEVAEVVARGGVPRNYDTLILPNLAEFRSVRHFACQLRLFGAWGITTYLAPSPEPLNARAALIEAVAALDEHVAERLAAAEARARIAEDAAEQKYEALFGEKVRALDATFGLASALAPTISHVLNGGAPALGARFREWREKEAKIPMKEVGRRLQRLGVTEGISETAISRFETSGRTSLHPEIIRRIMSGEGADEPSTEGAHNGSI